MTVSLVRRLLGGALAVIVTLSASAGFATSASAATSGIAYMRVAHLSPDTPKVDVYLTAFSGGSTKLLLSGVAYGDFSTYRRMAPGQYAMSMRPHGAKPTTAAALSWTVALKAGRTYTAAAYGQGGTLKSVVFDDDLATPAAQTGYVRIVQGSAQAGSVAASADGKKVAGGTGYGAISRYATVPAGHDTLTVSSRVDASLTSKVALTVAGRSVTSVVVLDKRGGGLVLRPIVDAAGMAGQPSGGVVAGGGGTAPVASSGNETSAALIGLVAIALGGGVGLWRRRVRHG